MILLATLLSFGWPAERTEWIPRERPALERTLKRVTLNSCCGSMRPAIQGGEVAYVEIYHGQPLHAGEIIDTGFSMHRIVATSKDAVKTSGDANPRADNWTPKNRVRWIVRYIMR